MDKLVNNSISKAGWIKVSEKLPELKQPVLAFIDGHFYIAEIFHFDLLNRPFWTFTSLGKSPTHWMPLPEPPKESEE